MSKGGQVAVLVVVVTLCLSGVGATVTVSGADVSGMGLGVGESVEPDGEAAGSGVEADAEAPSLVLEQRTLGNIFLANETVRIGVETDAPAVRWTVHDYLGRRVGNGTASVDAERTVTLPIESVGHYTLRVRTVGGSDGRAGTDYPGPPNETRTTLAVLPADGFDNDDDFFGMSTQFNADWDHGLMDVMDAAGVATVREDSGWAVIEETRGEYDFLPSDAYMDPLEGSGFDRLYILAYGNPLYGPNGSEYFTMPHTPAYREAFGNFARAAVDHYDDVDYVEVWNEPNLEAFTDGPAGTDPGAYADLLAATYPAVNENRSNVTVVGGSAAAHYGNDSVERIDTDWWEGMLASGGAEHMDAMSVHLYRDEPANFSADLAELRSLTREYNDGEALPIWVTELGWHTSPFYPGGDLETRQARHLVQSHARLKAAGVERLYWYTFQDTVWEGESSPQTDAGEVQFGLVRRHDNPKGGHTPKPGLVAYAVTSRQLAGAEFDRREIDAPVESYVFADGAERTRVLWADEPTDVTVRTAEQVTVTSVTGEETRLVPSDGEVYLTVGRDPLFVTGNATEIEAGAPVSVESSTATGSAPGVTVGVAGGDGGRTVTHTVGEASATVTAEAGATGTASLPREAGHGGRAKTAVDLVSVDGQAVGRLLTPVGAPAAVFGDPSFVTGMTVETRNASAGWFTEVNDVGARHSGFEPTRREGVSCWESDVSGGVPGRGLFVDVADSHAPAGESTVNVTVRYYGTGDGQLVAQYDGPRDGADWGGTAELSGSERWRTHTFEFPYAGFDDGLGSGHDFRLILSSDSADVCIASVAVGTDPPEPRDRGGPATDLGEGETATPTGATGTDAADGSDATTSDGPAPTADDGRPTGATDGDRPVSPGEPSDTGRSAAGHGFGAALALVAVALAAGWVGRRRE